MSQHTQIPVIDISDTAAESRIADELIQAAVVHGFVYIKNLGKDISVEEIDHTFELSRKFFGSPIEEKQKCAITENNHGWSAMHSETLDSKTQRIGDFKEAFNFGEFINGHAPQPMPSSLADHEFEVSQFFITCHNLCLHLLNLFGVGLHTDPTTWFSSRHNPVLGPSGCTLRLLYYPSIPLGSNYEPEIDIRAGAHSDYGSITLLFQRPGQPGLEILRPNGEWSPVAVSPPGTENDPSPPILVNIGDLLSYWTRGLFRSTVHRVVFPKEEKSEDRYSIAFFCHPADDTVLEPVPSELVSKRTVDEEMDEKAITAKEHLLERLKATYLSLYRDKEEK